MARYTEANESGVRMALSLSAVGDALGRAKYERPVLYVPQSAVGIACRISRHADVNVEVDDTLAPCEWYVEWDGMRFGSEGC